MHRLDPILIFARPLWQSQTQKINLIGAKAINLLIKIKIYCWKDS